jgi:hypothetical protein
MLVFWSFVLCLSSDLSECLVIFCCCNLCSVSGFIFLAIFFYFSIALLLLLYVDVDAI